MSLIDLKANRRHKLDRDKRFKLTPYYQSAPFYFGPTSKLVHRVKTMTKLKTPWERLPRFLVEYWCLGHAYNATELVVDDCLFFVPPEGALVCHRCELNAVQAGLPTSDELAGTHVCLGTCKPINICHPTEGN